MMRKSIAGVMIAGLCLAMVSVVFAAEIAETSIPQDATGTTPVYTGVDPLLSLYDERANAVLPILPPDESGSVRQVIDFGRVTIDETADGYSESFLNALSTKGVLNTDYNVITYPILIILEDRTHDYILSAHNGTELLRVERPKDYDPLWYSIEYFKQRELQPTRKEFKEHTIMYNPARLVGIMELVNQEGAKAIAEIEAQALAASTPLLPPAMMMSGGPYVGSLSVEGMEFNSPTNGDMTLTIGYPSGMEGVPLDIVGCDDLMNWNWSVLASTNAPSGTNQLNYIISPATTNRNFVTVYRTDVPAGDTDGDGVPDGEERYIDSTDSNDPDDPANIKGSIGYTTGHGGGGQTGVIYVVAVTNAAAWNTDISDSVAVTGVYHITKVPHGDYFIKAWCDSDGDGAHDTYEATGMYYTAAITVTSQWTDIDFTMTDTDSDADLMGDWWEKYYFGNPGLGFPSIDSDEDRLQNLYEYYAGTDPTDGFSDSDSDGMSDDWEDAFGLDKEDGSDADEDPDQDGFTSLAEYQSGSFGTDPLDRDSHPVYFVDVTATAFPGAGSLASSQNAAWGDYDNDGDPDLYLATGLWRNDSGTFTNIPNTAFGPGLWLDSNNDGYLDIFSWDIGSSDWALYTNTIASGTTGFVEDVSFPTPTTDGSMPGFRSFAACPVDVDTDGMIDLYVGGYESWEANYYDRISYRDSLIRNRSDLPSYYTQWNTVYVDGADTAPALDSYQISTMKYVNPALRTRGVTACDFDANGAPDIHVSRYRVEKNTLWQNAGDLSFADSAMRHGLEEIGQTISSAWGDLDNDGDFDLVSANLDHPPPSTGYDSQVYANLGADYGYAFSNLTEQVGLTWQEAYSCPSFADIDRDGDLDLFMTYAVGSIEAGRCRLFRNDGNWQFTEITTDSGLPTALSGGNSDQNAWADYDGDGDLDLFSGGKLYESVIDGGNWIELELSGDGSAVNAAAIDAVVRIEVGGHTLTRQVAGAIGQGNQDAFALHFGLGTNVGSVDASISWPGHSAKIITNLAINQSHSIAYVLPDNDDFADAAPLNSNSGKLVAHLENATTESGEPSHDPFWSPTYKSKWWRFEPTANGYLTLTAEPTGFAFAGPVLSVSTGASPAQLSWIGLTQLGGSSDDSGLYTIPVSSGAVYHVALAVRSSTQPVEAIVLNWNFSKTGHTWCIMDSYTSDSDYDPESIWIQAPGSGTNMVPRIVPLSDIPNDGDSGTRIFWPEANRPIVSQIIDEDGHELSGMGN